MNICFISPNPNKKDGIANYTLKLAEWFTDNKKKALLLSPPSSNPSVYPWHYQSMTLNPASIWKNIEIIRKYKVDVVHIQYAIPALGVYSINIWILSIIVRWSLHKKVAVTLHEVKRETNLLGVVSKIYFYVISLLVNIVIVHTEEAKNILKNQCFVADNKINIIPSYLYPKININRTTQTKKIIITFFGYIHVDKGIDHLIRAIRIVIDRLKLKPADIICEIAGDVRPREGIFKLFEKKDVDYKHDLIKLVENLDLSNYILFRGYMENTDLNILLSESYVYVIPYTNVEQSGVLHTVLPYGKPIIASRIGGLAETLDKSGILVKPGDHKAIANEIISLISDKNYYQKISTNYVHLKARLSLSKIGKLHLDAYNI